MAIVAPPVAVVVALNPAAVPVYSFASSVVMLVNLAVSLLNLKRHCVVQSSTYEKKIYQKIADSNCGDLP